MKTTQLLPYLLVTTLFASSFPAFSKEEPKTGLDTLGNTDLHRAIRRRDMEATSDILDGEAPYPYRSRNIWGNTPLHMAAWEGNVQAAMGLLNKGADSNARNKLEETPLHEAALNNRPQIITLLIERGANTEAKKQVGRYGPP